MAISPVSFGLEPRSQAQDSEEPPKTYQEADHYEGVSAYSQRFLGWISKTVTQTKHFWLLNQFRSELQSDLPKIYRDIFYQLNPREADILKEFIHEISFTNTPEAMIESVFNANSELTNLTSERTQLLIDLVRNIAANKTLMNTQFATDSLGTLLGLRDCKIDRYEGNVLTLQELMFKENKDPDEQKFAHDMFKAQEAARQEKILNAQWAVALTPGLGYMTHAGWEFISPLPGPFSAIRTLGLTRNGAAYFARVPLDFSILGTITKEQACALLNAIQRNANSEDPKTDPIQDIDPKAHPIIRQFSLDLDAACLKIHTNLRAS